MTWNLKFCQIAVNDGIFIANKTKTEIEQHGVQANFNLADKWYGEYLINKWRISITSTVVKQQNVETWYPVTDYPVAQDLSTLIDYEYRQLLPESPKMFSKVGSDKKNQNEGRITLAGYTQC